MLCISLQGPSEKQVREQIHKACLHADLLEFCIDHFAFFSLSTIQELLQQTALPVIITSKNEEKLLLLASLQPHYLDIDLSLASTLIPQVRAIAPHTAILVSYHDYTQTPGEEEILRLYTLMRAHQATHYKLAFFAHSTLDALRLLHVVQKHTLPILAVSMGDRGAFMRILTPIFSIPWSYACLEEHCSTAPGQIPAHLLQTRYRFSELSPQTALYGLIGHPVSSSISDRTHNAFFAKHALDAVYVKMDIMPEELEEFLFLAAELGFRGLSVTMPLKEKAAKLLSSSLASINTLCLYKKSYQGYSTDGLGAFRALQKHIPSLQTAKVAILGYGGAGKAIAATLREKGIDTTVYARTPHPPCRPWQELLQTKNHYDILINCTPTDPLEVVEHIDKRVVVMDLRTQPSFPLFLQKAQGCKTISGIEMFHEQALLQFTLFFPSLPLVYCPYSKLSAPLP